MMSSWIFHFQMIICEPFVLDYILDMLVQLIKALEGIGISDHSMLSVRSNDAMSSWSFPFLEDYLLELHNS